MREKPQKSFKRITEGLTEKFPWLLGMLDDMLTQIKEPKGKHFSRCPADMKAVLLDSLERGPQIRCCMQSLPKQAVSASPVALPTQSQKQKPKQQRLALNDAATAMHAALKAMDCTSLADSGKLKWEDFRNDLPTVIFRLLCTYLQSSRQVLPTAGQSVFTGH